MFRATLFFVPMIIWTSQKRKISDLIPAEYNPREMTEDQAKQLPNQGGIALQQLFGSKR